jgi:hypothetical protein
MRVAFAGCAALLLAGCATPRPIVDTASLVSRMSDAMDRSVANYVDSLKTVREADERRLQELRSDAQLRKLPIQEHLQILAVAEDDRPVRVMNALAMPVGADPLGPDAGLAAPPVPVKFDDTSLKSVITITQSIAKPPTATEQFKLLMDFAKAVNADLQKAADGNQKKPASPPQP